MHCNWIYVNDFMYEKHELGVDKGESLNMASTCMTSKLGWMSERSHNLSCMYMAEICQLYIYFIPCRNQFELNAFITICIDAELYSSPGLKSWDSR